MRDGLLPLPKQPDEVPWPTGVWPEAAGPTALKPLLDEVFEDVDSFGETYAVAVVQGGRLLADRYGGALPQWDAAPVPVEASTPLLSWSMAKSVLHAAVGLLVGDGRLHLDAPAPVPAWHDDERSAITLDHLLQMRDGLAWFEDYVDGDNSDAIQMLFGAGMPDMAAYGEARPLAHPPGTVFNYSSGSSNVVSAIVGRAAGDTRRLLSERLFGPIGMRSADARLDDAGTFVGSTYVYATAQDWARFGTLYLRDGVWEGRRVLPEGWVDHGRTVRSVDDVDGDLYGAHWWIDPWGQEIGSFRASGYEGQRVTVVPALDAVLVRLGKTPEAQKPQLDGWRRRVLETLG